MSKTALVIGASRGLGLGLVEQLSDAGWQVIASVRDPQHATGLKAVPGVRIEALDVTDAAGIEALAERLAGMQLDLLHINAGIAGPKNKPASQASRDEIGELFATNAVAPIRLAERLLPLVNPNSGVIAFMSSIMGSVESGPGMGMALYGASKTALNHLTRSFAAELGETGISVLSLHPGWVRTDMGGDEAPLDVATSCKGLVEQVTQAAGQGGHRFIDYQGDRLPW
ncbi:SDR family oxidoreductase [Pseudomonas lopnurensis]|uniref:SDR family oxidoreductase n=1 Tax=Pseudomonas lopnurensis TaxID=1477517 RepID=UPI00187AAE5B|nr:SDR family oxidoreductase [Pseudomonas lopnurensis]MBE7375499.1 SDR family oxidoreductase [Pseudomonas lopnurensis]